MTKDKENCPVCGAEGVITRYKKALEIVKERNDIIHKIKGYLQYRKDYNTHGYDEDKRNANVSVEEALELIELLK